MVPGAQGRYRERGENKSATNQPLLPAELGPVSWCPLPPVAPGPRHSVAVVAPQGLEGPQGGSCPGLTQGFCFVSANFVL